MFSDLRAALFAAYAVLLLWRTSSGAGLADWWKHLLVFVALTRLSYVAERVTAWWGVRRAVQTLRALDPAARDARLGRLWMDSAGRELADLVAAEGEAEVGAAVERFPFARGAKRGTVAALWSALSGAAVLLVSLLVTPRALPPAGAWAAWAGATLLLGGAAVARARLRHLETVLEVSAFGVAEVHPDDTRRVLRWGGPLVLRGRPRLRRLELSAPGAPTYIALDLDRVGIDRAVALVLRHGGFDVGPSPVGRSG
jgi:hypothetical protein